VRGGGIGGAVDGLAEFGGGGRLMADGV